MRKHTFRKQMASLQASGADASIITQTLQALFTQIRRARVKDPNSQPPRNYKRKPSKYEPHQGARECERRRIGGFASPRFSALIRNQLIINTQRSSLNPLI